MDVQLIDAADLYKEGYQYLAIVSVEAVDRDQEVAHGVVMVDGPFSEHAARLKFQRQDLVPANCYALGAHFSCVLSCVRNVSGDEIFRVDSVTKLRWNQG